MHEYYIAAAHALSSARRNVSIACQHRRRPQDDEVLRVVPDLGRLDDVDRRGRNAHLVYRRLPSGLAADVEGHIVLAVGDVELVIASCERDDRLRDALAVSPLANRNAEVMGPGG